MTTNTTRSVPRTDRAAPETDHATAETGRSISSRALAAALAVVVVAAPVLAAAPVVGSLATGASATTALHDGAAAAPHDSAATAGAGAATDLTAASTATGPFVYCGLNRSNITSGESVTIQVDPGDVDGVQYDKYGNGSFGDLTEVYQKTFTYDVAGNYTPQVKAWAGDNSTVEPCGNLTVVGAFEADLAYSPASPAPGEGVAFDASVSGDYEGSLLYEWDFDGDGQLDAETLEPAAQYEYPEVGNYSVTLRVTDEAGQTATVERVVTVTESTFDVELAYEPEAPRPGETVGFAADVVGDVQSGVEYAWDFTGNGEFETTAEPTAEHTYAEQGEYPVTVRVTDGDRTATAERVVVVEGESVSTETETPEPADTPAEGEVTAEWWYTPLEPRAGEVVTLAAEGGAVEGVTYEWDLDGDGSAEATGQVVSHTFPEAGGRNVTLRVSVAGGEDLTATQTIAVEEYIGAGSAVEGPTFWYTPLDPRAGEMVVLVASPENPEAVEEFAWDLDGDGSVDQRGPVASHTFPTNGSTAVTLELHRTDGSVERVGNNVTVELSANETIRRRTTIDGPLDRIRRRVEEIPGFGVPAVLLALLVLLLAVAVRRRWSDG